MERKSSKQVLVIISAIVLSGIIALFFILGNTNNDTDNAYNSGNFTDNNVAIKVDISMTSFYGSIDYILIELGLNFNLVTMGANCYSGVQRNQFETTKFGILYTEFTYCKTSSTQIFRVYNKASDQPLRNPKAGELKEFSYLGSPK